MGFLQRINWMIWITVILIYLLNFQNVSGLSCYVCATHPRRGADVEKCREDGPIKECPSHRQNSCEETRFSGTRGVVRYCSSTIEEDGHCMDGRTDRGPYHTCICTTDGCNNKMSQGSRFKGEHGKNYIFFIGTIFIISGLYWS